MPVSTDTYNYEVRFTNKRREDITEQFLESKGEPLYWVAVQFVDDDGEEVTLELTRARPTILSSTLPNLQVTE